MKTEWKCQRRGCEVIPEELVKRTEFKGNTDLNWYCESCWDKKFKDQNIKDISPGNFVEVSRRIIKETIEGFNND